MRIIAGSAKGRRLSGPRKGSEIRPILGRARQSLFDTLRPWITGSHFLDLYAGTGAVGFEALSRGASFVCFVDKAKEALRLIESNIKKLGFVEKALVHGGDILGAGLWLLKNRLPQPYPFSFDIVFVAPPYTYKLTKCRTLPYLALDRRGAILEMSVQTVENLLKADLLSKDAWVVLQHHKKEPLNQLPKELRVVREAKYGETRLTYLRFIA